MDRRRRSARAAEPPRALRRASIGERRCARYPLAAVRDSLSSPRPSPIRRPPPRLPYSTARRFFRALWLRRSLRDPRLQLPPKRPCPPSGACRQPAFLPVRGEGLATGKCPSRAAAATTHRSAQRPQRTPLPDDGARPGRSAPPSSTLRPGRPLRIEPAEPRMDSCFTESFDFLFVGWKLSDLRPGRVDHYPIIPDNRNGEDECVDSVKDTSVAGQKTTGILDPRAALVRRFEKIAHLPRHVADSSHRN